MPKSKYQLQKTNTAKLPTKYGIFSVCAYKEKKSRQEHLALICGKITGQEPVLTRVHSACVTGDVFGSRRCDCQAQLHKALHEIGTRGRGILVYLDQEGRGIGLANKIKAYELQDHGLDTVEANLKLGFRHDERNYTVAGQILQDLGIRKIELLTNNPEKIKDLEALGLIVARVRFWTGKNKNNSKYLQTKIKKMGHLKK